MTLLLDFAFVPGDGQVLLARNLVGLDIMERDANKDALAPSELTVRFSFLIKKLLTFN